MLKDFFLNEVEEAILKAIKENKLGQAQEYTKGSLIIEKPKNPDFGDFAVNVSSLARTAKIAPPMIANAIVENLSQKNYTVSVIGGFINLKTDNILLAEAIEEILQKKENYGRPEKIEKEKILLEYVSANPTGPFHIGHGRWAAMGSALANLLKFYGHEVYQEFYINDAGSQIQKLGNSLKIRVQQELGQDVDFPTDEIERKNYYPGEYLIPVAKKFLSEHEPTDDIQVLSDYAKKEMEACQKALLEEFRVHFDNFYSELELHKSGKVEESFKALMAKGMLYEKDGAMWFKSSEFGDDQDRVIKKADGSNTYLTADIAYHADKFERGFDECIDVWGADHHGYVPRMKAAVTCMQHDPENDFHVVLIQMVNLMRGGEPVAMSTRSGEFVTLREVLDDVGTDAARYMFLSRKSDSPLDFDLDLVKQRNMENPVYYVQYAHARVAALLRRAADRGVEMPERSSLEMLAPLTSADDLSLLREVERFRNVVEDAARARAAHPVSFYLMELAGKLHSYYANNPVLSGDDEAVMKARLALLRAVSVVIANGLDLLGVSAPESM